MAYGRATITKVVEDHPQYIRNSKKSKSRLLYWRSRNRELRDALSAWLNSHGIHDSPYADLMASHWIEFSRYCNCILKKSGLDTIHVECWEAIPEKTAFATIMIAQYYFL